VVARIAMFDATERRAYERELVAARQRAEESEERATTLARTLQESFLPPTMPVLPGLDVAGAYRPAGDGCEVGGDFYDVFSTGPGTWGVVLGDVCGKGAPAAVLTSLARYAVRAEAPRTASPGAVLAGLHETLLAHDPDKFCTAVFAALDLTSDDVRVTLSVGGHPLPLLVRSGECVAVGEPGTIVGMVDVASYADTRVVLRPGYLLVLYTDGVTEARHDGEFFGDDRLRATVAAAAGGSARDVADAVVAAALDFQRGDARDDIAVVAIRLPEPRDG
jgi:sigma-B regulation protein RsbU (phosphoserine phosphatase)